MSSFYFKTKKRMIAWICAITMVVAGLAVAPKTVVADEEAGTTAVDWSNITEWTQVGKTDIYYSITNTKGMFNRVNVVNNELFYFITNRGDFEATITGPKTDDVVEKKCAGAEIELRKSDFPTDGYYTIDTTKLDGLQIAVKRDSSSSGGGEVSAPKAPTSLEAHIGGGNTFYTIAFAPVDGAKSYKFYLDGEYRQDITNGGTVTIEKLGLKAGQTYKFGVSAVNAAGVESGITTIDVKVPGKEEATKYTVSIDGTEKAYEEGATISVPAEGQGYYDVTKKVAYAPGAKLPVNENMTLKSIELNVTMTPGASIRLAAPTGLRFQTTVKSGNGIDADEILNSATVTTGTLITTLDLYKDNGKTLTKDSKYNFLDIANNGWFNDGAKTETGKFCGSIIKIQSKNYGRAYIAVGYATIKYSDGSSKTVYADVTENNAKSIAYVAGKVKDSKKFSGYSPEQKDIINKYINGEEIPE